MEEGTQRPNRLIRWPEVQKRVGLSHSQVYKLMASVGPDGSSAFPKQIKLGERASGWLESEIDDWINYRVETHRGGGEDS